MSRPAITRTSRRGPSVRPDQSGRSPEAGSPEAGSREGQGAHAAQDARAAQVTTLVPRRTRWTARLRRLRRSSWRWKLGVPLLIVVLLAAGSWFVWSGPVLVLNQVSVRGVPSSSADDVRAAAQLPVGRPMVRLDLAAAQRRVAAIRTVRSAEVTRSWPTTVTIAVTLRTPVAVVKDAQGRLHLADSTGTAYAEVSSPPPDVPLVDADATDPAAVQSVVQVLAALPARMRAQVTSAQAKGPDAVTLTLGQVTVLWGGPGDSSLKASALQALRRANPKAHRFDLSAPHAPSVG